MVEKLQAGIVECLAPHADAVDWQCQHPLHECFRHIVRVTFDGDLSIRRHLIIFINGIENLMKLGNGELTRCSTTQVDGTNGVVIIPHYDFPTEGIDILLTESESRCRIETTIDTSASAKWNMYV